MKYCSKCGAELNGRFCSACGHDNEAQSFKSKLNGWIGTVKGWLSVAWEFILKHKKKFIIGASAFVVALVTTIVLVVNLSNIYSVGRVSRITIGMSQRQVESILGEPLETKYSNWYWYEDSVYKKAMDAEQMLEDAFMSENESKIDKATEQYDKIFEEIAKMEYKFIMVSFDGEGNVSEVFLDQKHKYEGGIYGEGEKELKNVALSIDKLSLNEIVDGEEVIEVSVADESPLVTYSAEFKDGSFYRGNARVSVEEVDTAAQKATVKWRDRFAEYEKEVRTSVSSRISTDGELLIWNDKSENMILPTSVRSITRNSVIQNKGTIKTIVFGNTSCTLSAAVLNEFTSLRYNIYEGGSYLGTANNPYAYFIKPNGGTLTTLHENVTAVVTDAFKGCTELTSITIPNSFTSIDDYAFEGCTGLKSITIPNSVTSIGYNAFRGCTSLNSITLPFVGNTKNGTSNTHFGYIFGASNYYDNERYVPSGLNTVVITGGSSIGDYAFSGCTGLTSITIPESVTSIGEGAFYGCAGLKSITIPNSVTSIGYNAFYGCTSLNSITLPFVGNTKNGTSNTHFGYIFGAPNSNNERYVPSGLNTVVITGGSSIGDDAFYNCTGLTSINIPDSVTVIGRDAFRGCTGLTSINVDSDNTAYKSIDGNLYSKSGKLLIQYAIGKTDSKFTIPDSVTSIGEYAFYDCTGLTSITIPGSVTSISSSAFRGCTGLTSITIPDSVTSIGGAAFRGCTSLNSITLPFVGNTKNGTSNTHFGYIFGASDSFYHDGYVPSSLRNVVITSETSILNEAFVNCTGLTSITISDSVTRIGGFAFSGCTGLKSVTIGNSVTRIDDYAFSGCTGLTSITIPNSVTHIGGYAFSGCTGLTSITIPDSVTDIGNSAFRGCTGLTSIIIPDSVTRINDYAFLGCTNLTIYCEAESEPVTWSSVWNLDDCPVVWGYKG